MKMWHFELDFNLQKLKHGAMCSQTRKLNAELTCETIPPRFNYITCKIRFARHAKYSYPYEIRDSSQTMNYRRAE